MSLNICMYMKFPNDSIGPIFDMPLVQTPTDVTLEILKSKNPKDAYLEYVKQNCDSSTYKEQKTQIDFLFNELNGEDKLVWSLI